MENLAGPRLLQAFFEYATNEALSNLDNLSKAALRLSCKNAKAFVDGTVTTAAGQAPTLETLLRCDWQLSELCIKVDYQLYPAAASLSENTFTSSLYALCSKFPTLQVLNISIPVTGYDVPANIGQLSKLSVLKLRHAYFRGLPASFGQLSLLERFEFNSYGPNHRSSQVTIAGLAPLKQLTQLKYLRLGGSLVEQPFFPAWLGTCHFPVLEDLWLDGELLSLPSSISNFSNLTALNIERSRIPEVPESIGCLNLLKKLHLPRLDSQPQISLPTSFSKLTSLEELDVTTDVESFALVEHANKLTHLGFFNQLNDEVIMPYPDFLWTFTSLQTLLLWGSNVPSLPDALGNLKNLECLLLGSLYVEELPESLVDLTCLTSLWIQHCGQLKIPESIGNLKKLRELGIDYCDRLRTLPESLGDLQRLEKLEIRYLQIFERLPSSIGNLHALKVLIVANSGKVNLPDSFADLVLDKPIEECSLARVDFTENKNILSGPRATLALSVLQERGVLRQ
jgi:Leucine-rich repeat (LRR) protein